MFKVYTYMYVCMHYNTHDDPSFHVKFHISIKISFYGCDLENETLGTKLKYLCKHALGGANMKVSLTCCWKIRIYSPTYHYNGCNIPVTRPNRPIWFLLGAFPRKSIRSPTTNWYDLVIEVPCMVCGAWFRVAIGVSVQNPYTMLKSLLCSV